MTTSATGRLLRALHHYEIVVPTTVDHSGEFIGYDVTRRLAHAHGRTKRSTADAPRLDKRIFYKLSAYGTDYRFNLTLNTRLLASRFVVQYWDGTGVTRQHRHPTPCQYVGHVVDSRHPSTVALSNCDGLVSKRGAARSPRCARPSLRPDQDAYRRISRRDEVG